MNNASSLGRWKAWWKWNNCVHSNSVRCPKDQKQIATINSQTWWRDMREG